MILKEQIISIVFSFFYGAFVSIIYNFNYKLLFDVKKILKIIFSLVFTFNLVVIYFLFIKKINGGIIHPYFYLIIVVGFFSFFNISKPLRKIINQMTKNVNNK